MVFDFVDGAAGTESSIRRSRELFDRVEFAPRSLRDVTHVDMSVDILGARADLPFFFAPTGATRLMHAGGETTVARVARDAGIPYTLSTFGTTSVESLAAAVPNARRWFQLYLTSDRGASERLVRRAWDNGFDTLVLAVDCPVPGRRNRDVRNGLIVPPKLTWRSVWRIAPYPRWWFDKLTTAPVQFAMIDAASERPAERMAKVFDPSITLQDVEWLRAIWPGKLVIKGIQSAEDAREVLTVGADAVHLSTHGGRQLDRAPLPLELIPAVRSAVGDGIPIIVDGGVLSGADIVAACAMGADFVAIGRAYLYGLMAAGELGVKKVVDLLRSEIRTTLALTGRTSIRELDPDLVRMRDR
jgi:L-lactate dehydrogenase (cytochrome)